MERNVRALADATGEPIEEAINQAAIERTAYLDRLRGPRGPAKPVDMEKIYAILRKVDAMPRLDYRTADEIIGYDENGLPR